MGWRLLWQGEGVPRITSKSPTCEREVTPHIIPGLLLGTLNIEMSDLIGPSSVVANLRVTSKKQALQELAKRAAELTTQPKRAIFKVLIERERLGTTGVGNGIAIPHGKLPDLDRLYALFARLETPIDFDAIDQQPVDLICVLLAPETAGAGHLKALARVWRLLHDRAICEKLRGTDSTEAIHALLTESMASHAA